MTGFFKDLFSGNFSGALADITDGLAKLPAPVQAFIVKVEDDAEGLLMSLAQTAYSDVVAGGLSTASFVAAGKDVVAKAATQGATILMSDAMVAVNLVASAAGVVTAPVAAPETPDAAS
jgi:hypothetical protein